MAEITGLKERQIALTQIESKIKALKPLNLFLKTPNDSNIYSLKFDKIKFDLFCENKEILDELVRTYKKKLVDEIQEMAQKYSIAFDEEEQQIMNDLFVPGNSKSNLEENK